MYKSKQAPLQEGPNLAVYIPSLGHTYHMEMGWTLLHWNISYKILSSLYV